MLNRQAWKRLPRPRRRLPLARMRPRGSFARIEKLFHESGTGSKGRAMIITELRSVRSGAGLAFVLACTIVGMGVMGCSRNSEKATIAFNKGLEHFNNGEYEKAIEFFDEAIRLEPSDPVARYNRGLAYQELRQPDKAIADHNEAIRLNPNFALAYLERGNAHADQKRRKEATDDYKKAKALDPELDVPLAEKVGSFIIGEDDDFVGVADGQKQALMAIVKVVPSVNYAYDERGPSKSVRAVILERGGFGDDVLVHLASFPDLKLLTVISDDVTNAGIKHLGKLAALEQLALILSQLTAEGLEPLQSLPALKSLSLNSKKIDNAAVPQLKKFGQLESLSLSNASLDDAGFGMLAENSQLKGLRIERAAITDEGLKHLKKMPKLEHFSAGFTKITDGGFKQLQASMPNLKVVRTDQDKDERRGFHFKIKP